MSQEIADSVRGRARVVAVSDAFRLAPWADAMFASDRAWWTANPDAIEFAGQKFSGMKVQGVSTFKPAFPQRLGCNSGLVACMLAESLGATKIILLGFDLNGEHYFGEHPPVLKKTSPARFHGMRIEFSKWKHRAHVVNATPHSHLQAFPATTLEAALCH